MNILKRFIPLLCAAFLLACCVAGFVTPASALTAPDTNSPPDGWYAVCVIMNGFEVFSYFAEEPLQSVVWAESQIDFNFGDGLTSWYNIVSPADYTITSGDITSTDYGNLRFYDGEYVSDIGHVWYFYVNSVAAVEPPTTEPPATTPEDDTPASPSAGVFPQLYDMLSEFIYGVNSDVLTASQDFTLTLLATIGAIFVVAIPFFIVWKAINMLG